MCGSTEQILSYSGSCHTLTYLKGILILPLQRRVIKKNHPRMHGKKRPGTRQETFREKIPTGDDANREIILRTSA
jgi:hypothetical protein